MGSSWGHCYYAIYQINPKTFKSEFCFRITHGSERKPYKITSFKFYWSSQRYWRKTVHNHFRLCCI